MPNFKQPGRDEREKGACGKLERGEDFFPGPLAGLLQLRPFFSGKEMNPNSLELAAKEPACLGDIKLLLLANGRDSATKALFLERTALLVIKLLRSSIYIRSGISPLGAMRVLKYRQAGGGGVGGYLPTGFV